MKALDPRVVDKAKASFIGITPNVLLDGSTPEAPLYGQHCNVTYDLLDNGGHIIGHANRSHVTVSSPTPLGTKASVVAVKDALAAWLSADRADLADNDADAVATPVA
jgi:hypothetical protein